MGMNLGLECRQGIIKLNSIPTRRENDLHESPWQIIPNGSQSLGQFLCMSLNDDFRIGVVAHVQTKIVGPNEEGDQLKKTFSIKICSTKKSINNHHLPMIIHVHIGITPHP